MCGRFDHKSAGRAETDASSVRSADIHAHKSAWCTRLFRIVRQPRTTLVRASAGLVASVTLLKLSITPCRVDIDGIDRGAAGHEQPVALGATEDEVGDWLRHGDMADGSSGRNPRARRCPIGPMRHTAIVPVARWQSYTPPGATYPMARETFSANAPSARLIATATAPPSVDLAGSTIRT